jgi:hypothetical protein
MEINGAMKHKEARVVCIIRQRMLKMKMHEDACWKWDCQRCLLQLQNRAIVASKK